MSATDYDGPRLSETIKFSVLFGPEGGYVGLPAEPGAVYVTPQTAYQRRDDEWVDIGTDALYRSIAGIVDPEAIRERERR